MESTYHYFHYKYHYVIIFIIVVIVSLSFLFLSVFNNAAIIDTVALVTEWIIYSYMEQLMEWELAVKTEELGEYLSH